MFKDNKEYRYYQDEYEDEYESNENVYDDRNIVFSINRKTLNIFYAVSSLILAFLFALQGINSITNDGCDYDLLNGSRFMFYFFIICMFYNIFKAIQISIEDTKIKKNAIEAIRADYIYSSKF